MGSPSWSVACLAGLLAGSVVAGCSAWPRAPQAELEREGARRYRVDRTERHAGGSTLDVRSWSDRTLREGDRVTLRIAPSCGGLREGAATCDRVASAWAAQLRALGVVLVDPSALGARSSPPDPAPVSEPTAKPGTAEYFRQQAARLRGGASAEVHPAPAPAPVDLVVSIDQVDDRERGEVPAEGQLEVSSADEGGAVIGAAPADAAARVEAFAADHLPPAACLRERALHVAVSVYRAEGGTVVGAYVADLRRTSTLARRTSLLVVARGPGWGVAPPPDGAPRVPPRTHACDEAPPEGLDDLDVVARDGVRRLHDGASR